MSRYKKIMLQRGVMQKDVLADVRKVDPRVDNPLLSKFVNTFVYRRRARLKVFANRFRAPRSIFTTRAK